MRIDGYARIQDYALIGDGRTVALVARDGAIDWLCLPNLDSPSVLGALLDSAGGGSFDLRPCASSRSSRRYLAGTNVLETTFTTDEGSVRVLDALTLPTGGLEPGRELARSIEGLAGTVRMEWRLAPRFEYGRQIPRCETRNGVPVASRGAQALAVSSWDAGGPAWRSDGTLDAQFDVRTGDHALVSLSVAVGEPLVFPGRREVEQRLAATTRFWREWTDERQYDGPWRDLVLRSALVLKALIFAPSGAPVAAPTTSLPEALGGPRNWDYRFCWIRDSNFIIDALLELGCHREAQSLFWWFMQATALTEPRLHVLYRLDGGVGSPERDLPLAGYRASRPVRIGNGAIEQAQLDIYGDLLETAWLYSESHHRLDSDTGAVLARVADYVCTIWRQPDSGIWEVRNGPWHFTHSKVMCWVALDRAIRLAARGELPARHVDRWRREAAAIADFVEQKCWSDRRRSYTRAFGDDRADASLLMLSAMGYADPRGERMNGTIEAIQRDLRDGDFVYRYRADDGVPGEEGCFLNCSFWLVAALARAGRIDEACALMERLTARANDVGLYAEEADPGTGDFLGNFPQALVHLALIDAALAVGRAGGSASERHVASATARARQG